MENYHSNIFTQEEIDCIKTAQATYPLYKPTRVPANFKDISGCKFGRLKVLYRTTSTKTRSGAIPNWICLCDCGNIISVTYNALKNGFSISCGCYNREKAQQRKKFNKYDLDSNPYGIGWTTNTNKEFYFDLEDYDKIKNYCWYENDQGYIIGVIDRHTNIRLHRLVMDAQPGDLVDHKFGKRYDNRKSELRFATKQTNGINRGCNITNNLGAKGVSMTKSGKYSAKIMVDGKQHHLGTFATLEEAKEVRFQAEQHYFGDFAYTQQVH